MHDILMLTLQEKSINEEEYQALCRSTRAASPPPITDDLSRWMSESQWAALHPLTTLQVGPHIALPPCLPLPQLLTPAKLKMHPGGCCTCRTPKVPQKALACVTAATCVSIGRRTPMAQILNPGWASTSR